MKGPLRHRLAAIVCLALLGGAACKGDGRGSSPASTPAKRGDAPAEWAIAFDREVDGVAHVLVVPAAGGIERRLTSDSANEMLPRWTPDGERIVYTSERSGTPQLWEVAAEGGTPRRLRKNDATEYQADVSPDGKTLAFLSNYEGPERLLLQDLGTGQVRELVRHTDNTIFGNPHWSPDGRWIAFSSNRRIGHQIYLVEVATGKERRLSPFMSGGCEPRFSPDGRKVIYVSRGHLAATSRLVEQDLETGEEKALISWPALNYDPVYSPDGSELAFASNIAGHFAIYRQRLSDGQAWRVTFEPGQARNPDYRPVP